MVGIIDSDRDAFGGEVGRVVLGVRFDFFCGVNLFLFVIPGGFVSGDAIVVDFKFCEEFGYLRVCGVWVAGWSGAMCQEVGTGVNIVASEFGLSGE